MVGSVISPGSSTRAWTIGLPRNLGGLFSICLARPATASGSAGIAGWTMGGLDEDGPSRAVHRGDRTVGMEDARQGQQAQPSRPASEQAPGVGSSSRGGRAPRRSTTAWAREPRVRAGRRPTPRLPRLAPRRPGPATVDPGRRPPPPRRGVRQRTTRRQGESPRRGRTRGARSQRRRSCRRGTRTPPRSAPGQRTRGPRARARTT